MSMKCRIRIENVKKQIKRYLYASQHGIKVDALEMESRIKRMKAAVGDWIVKEQRASHFSTTHKGNAEEAKKSKGLWNSSLGAKMKKEFRIVNLNELETHFTSLDHHFEPNLSEAISSAKWYKTWKYILGVFL